VRTVYLGTSDFAATVLELLAASAHRPQLVVTRPARPKGRGKKLTDPPVADTARALGIELIQPESVNSDEALELIRAATPQALCVCAYGAIVKEPLLSLAPTFNVHPSLLPRWRGAAPVERAIAAGDLQTGVSIMELVEDLDAGPVCAVATEPIGPDDDYGSLAPRLAQTGGRLLVEALDTAAAGVAEWREQQPPEAVTYAEKITREDRVLDPRRHTARELELRVRALAPHIGAAFELTEGGPLRVDQARAVDSQLAAGEFAAVDGTLAVGTAQGALELLQVRPAGGKSMDAAAFLRGYPVPALK
jgi:methionyl-tRNA formyltransferase